MAVKIIIRRSIPEDKKAELLPLIIKLRTLATTQPGYIHGETLINADNLEEWVVISTWVNLDAWRDWSMNPQRAEINDKLEAGLHTKTECDAYFYGEIYLHSKKG
ncbi:MAG: antibiotic biosynthesis monooxygenase [Deltaproteobacteria bacterium]|nr:antibiotic biosynthesis monooxygenase [Deltaproteobacteria bacterium]